jgi:hypothetical protein
MARLLAAAAFIALVAGGCFYYLAYPPVVLKRQTVHALEAFAQSVKTKDRTKISEQLGTLLGESAIVHLEVNLFSLTQQDKPPMLQRDFSKQEFIPFVDNTLYPLSDYDYQPQLESFALAGDGQTADVMFSSKEWADGVSYYAGTAVQMRYSSDTACGATLHFVAKQPVIDRLSCAMALRMVPKPGEREKMMNPEALRQLLR